jgi:hypothetical protein
MSFSELGQTQTWMKSNGKLISDKPQNLSILNPLTINNLTQK